MPQNRGLVARAAITIDAPVARVWDALVDSDKIKAYMFGTTVVSEWEEGAPIVWKGEWEGTAYEDKGEILTLEPRQMIQYSHFSPLSGHPDVPENYHTVTIELSREGPQTRVTLSQDNNASEEERQHAAKNWNMMLQGLKDFVEE
ncbi:MAG: SRPBCC domain-containing protein [Chloroflexi bacterium]|nr:SRPBCC domain-containing protein [Chloroflexota bacterium]